MFSEYLSIVLAGIIITKILYSGGVIALAPGHYSQEPRCLMTLMVLLGYLNTEYRRNCFERGGKTRSP